MDKNNLDVALEVCFEAIEKTDINIVDKTELLINLRQFFITYDDSIAVLIRNKKECRW